MYENIPTQSLRERGIGTVQQWREEEKSEIYGMSYSDYQRVVISAHKQQTSEHYKFMQKELAFQRALGVSTNVGPVFGTDYNTHPKSSFELWKEAREKFIKGEIDDVELVLKYVREDEPGYSKIVDMEIAEERKSKEVDSGVHKHRFNWRRWPTWRWLVPWLHR